MKELRFNPLREFRERNNLRQRDLADFLGISTAFMSQVETGSRQFPPVMLDRIRSRADWDSTPLEDFYAIMDRKAPRPPRQYRLIPLYNLDARGGFETNEEVDVPEYIVDRIPFQNAHMGDICIPVSGDSMSPVIPSGSVVLLRELQPQDGKFYPEYGNTYVLMTADGQRLLKRVRKGTDGEYLLESFNKDYDPMSMPTKLVRKMWRVISMYAKITM